MATPPEAALLLHFTAEWDTEVDLFTLWAVKSFRAKTYERCLHLQELPRENIYQPTLLNTLMNVSEMA